MSSGLALEWINFMIGAWELVVGALSDGPKDKGLIPWKGRPCLLLCVLFYLERKISK